MHRASLSRILVHAQTQPKHCNLALACQRIPLMMFEKNESNDNHNYRQQKHKK